jgi:bile acid-coenzyme A ligase
VKSKPEPAESGADDPVSVESFLTVQEHAEGIPLGLLPAYHADRDPNRPAITIGDRTVSRAELEARANRRARALAALGVGQDDFITVALPNGLEFYETAFAIWKLGGTVNPVSWRLPDAELKAIVETARPKLIIGTDPARVSGFKVVPQGFEPDPTLSADPLPPRVARYWRAMTSGGSTGRPKVIVDHMEARWDPAMTFAMQQAGDTILNAGPLYHNGPFMYAMKGLFAGGHVVEGGKFDAEHTLQLIQDHQINWAMLVPTMMNRIWRLPEAARTSFDLSSLRIMFHTAAHCPVWLKMNWIEWLGPDRVWEGYGGTEAQGGCIIGGREALEHPGSVGKPFPGTQMKILDDQGREAAPGEIGEIFFLPRGGRNSTYHYIGAEAKAAGEWESIGDLGYFGRDGYLYLADRRTDLIISAGVNIYPAEVEAAIDLHPDVVSSVAIGLPDDDLGQRVHAIVEVRPGTGLTEAALMQHLKGQIVVTKLPRSIEFVTEPLRGEDGKVRRSALRQERVLGVDAGDGRN